MSMKKIRELREQVVEPLHEYEPIDPKQHHRKLLNKDGTKIPSTSKRKHKPEPIEDTKMYKAWMASTGLKRAFLVAFAECGNIVMACNVAGLNPRQVHTWIRNDEEFALDLANATEYSIGTLEVEARRRAMEGSDRLLEFLLKSLKPEVYRERYEVKQEVTGDYVIDISNPTTEDTGDITSAIDVTPTDVLE